MSCDLRASSAASVLQGADNPTLPGCLDICEYLVCHSARASGIVEQVSVMQLSQLEKGSDRHTHLTMLGVRPPTMSTAETMPGCRGCGHP